MTVMQSLNCGTAGYLSGAVKNSGILGSDNVSLGTFLRTEVGTQKEMDSLTNTHFKLTNTRICPYLSFCSPLLYPSYVAHNTIILFEIIGHIKYTNWSRLTFRRLMSYIYAAPILDVSRSHTTTQHSR